MNKINTKKMSDSEIEEIFTTAYEKQIAIPNNISEFEVKCIRDFASKRIDAFVSITGFAGSPTIAQYRLVKPKKIVITDVDNNVLEFSFNERQQISLGGIDYQVVYECN